MKTKKVSKKASAKKVTKKAPAKKAATKKAAKKVAVKKAVAKKSAVKKATKKVVTTKAVATKKVSKRVSGTPNKELKTMLATIEKAKKAGESSVIAFTTAREHHNDGGGHGFGFQDLKPELQEAYKHLMCNFKNFRTNLVSMSDKAVQWIVDLK